MRTCVELGHAMGNQHWPALVKDTVVYVPLTVDRKVMASVMNTHRFEGIRYEFVPGRDVIPYLAPHESRRLFGGAEGTRALPYARELCWSRIRERTRSRTSADACPCPPGSSGTNIAGNGRFCTCPSRMMASRRRAVPHFSRGCCSLVTRCFPLARSPFSSGLEFAIRGRCRRPTRQRFARSRGPR